MSKIEKAKKFVKESKKEIIVGTICTAVGVCCGWKMYELSKDGLRAKALFTAQNCELFCDIVKDADRMGGFVMEPEALKLGKGWERCMEAMTEHASNPMNIEELDPTGFVIFARKK